jgi:hypothetical protein
MIDDTSADKMARTTPAMRRTGSGFGALQIAITALVALAALAHVFLGVNMVMALMSPAREAAPFGTLMTAILGVLFFCNFGGYVVLVAALYLPMLRRFQRVTRVLLIAYAALSIVAYFAVEQSHWVSPVGLFVKAIEVAIITLLVIEGRRVRA